MLIDVTGVFTSGCRGDCKTSIDVRSGKRTERERPLPFHTFPEKPSRNRMWKNDCEIRTYTCHRCPDAAICTSFSTPACQSESHRGGQYHVQYHKRISLQYYFTTLLLTITTKLQHQNHPIPSVSFSPRTLLRQPRPVVLKEWVPPLQSPDIDTESIGPPPSKHMM